MVYSRQDVLAGFVKICVQIKLALITYINKKSKRDSSYNVLCVLYAKYMLSSSHILTSLVFTVTFGGSYYSYFHLTGEETRTERVLTS